MDRDRGWRWDRVDCGTYGKLTPITFYFFILVSLQVDFGEKCNKFTKASPYNGHNGRTSKQNKFLFFRFGSNFDFYLY